MMNKNFIKENSRIFENNISAIYSNVHLKILPHIDLLSLTKKYKSNF